MSERIEQDPPMEPDEAWEGHLNVYGNGVYLLCGRIFEKTIGSDIHQEQMTLGPVTLAKAISRIRHENKGGHIDWKPFESGGEGIKNIIIICERPIETCDF